MLVLILLVIAFIACIFWLRHDDDDDFPIFITVTVGLAFFFCLIVKPLLWTNEDMQRYENLKARTEEFNRLPDSIRLEMKESEFHLHEEVEKTNYKIIVNRKRDGNLWKNYWYDKELGKLKEIELKK